MRLAGAFFFFFLFLLALRVRERGDWARVCCAVVEEEEEEEGAFGENEWIPSWKSRSKYVSN